MFQSNNNKEPIEIELADKDDSALITVKGRKSDSNIRRLSDPRILE